MEVLRLIYYSGESPPASACSVFTLLSLILTGPPNDHHWNWYIISQI